MESPPPYKGEISMGYDYDLDDIEDKLEELQNLDYVSQENYQTVEEMINHLKADPNVSNNRTYKYLYTFKTLFKKFIDYDLKQADKEDMRGTIGNIEASDYSEWTKRDHRKIIKRTFRTLYPDDTDRPDRVTKILNARFMKSGSKVERQRELEPLTPEEVLKQSENANNPRDKLLPVFMFESGARISEVTSVQLRDLQIHDKYVEVKFKTLKNDKGPRELVLTRCSDLIKEWLKYHPRSDDPEAPLFVNIGGGKGSRKGDKLTGSNAQERLRDLADRSNIDKRITNHLYRHSSATFYGMSYSVARMVYKYGWKQMSTAETYVHENKNRMKNAKLEEEGLKSKDENTDFDRQICESCGETWCPTKKYCGKCSSELEDQEEEDMSEMSNEKLVEKIERLEEMVQESS